MNPSQKLSELEHAGDDVVWSVSSLDNLPSNEFFPSQCPNELAVKHFHVAAKLFECEGFRSPTMKKSRNLIHSIIRMRNLEQVSFYGKMSLDNLHDVEIINDAISKLPNLKSLDLDGFVVYATDHPGVQPLLEPLIKSVSTMHNLECFHLVCFACYKRWDRAFCGVDALRSLCQMSNLEQISLSGVGLQDEHFVVIAEELTKNKGTRIRELILNNNKNSDSGARAIAGLLETNSLIERLETHNCIRLTEATCEYIAQQIERNYGIKFFSANLQHDYRSKVEFYLLLNRIGRKTMSYASPAKFVDIISSVDDNVSLLMRMLQENPSIFRQCVLSD